MFILPEIPSLGKQLGAGIGEGLSQSAKMAAQLGLDKRKQTRTQELMRQLLGQQDTHDLQGSSAVSKDQDIFGAPKMAAAASGDLGTLARILSDEAKQKRKESFTRENTAEKDLLGMEDKLRSLEESGARFERLSELSSPEHEMKFPSRTMAALFTKEGELNPLMQSQLSEDAQEYSKLLADELGGVKGMVGSRVTNYDIQAYMKRLPSLINSPEGRRRVLRDLKLMNQLNKEYYTGLLDSVQEQGGVGNRSLSSITRDFKKRFAKRETELRKQLIAGEKHAFNDLPDPATYVGEEMVDEETGQRFISDGKEWKMK